MYDGSCTVAYCFCEDLVAYRQSDKRAAMAPPVDSYGPVPKHRATEKRGHSQISRLLPSRVSRAAAFTSRPTEKQDDDDVLLQSRIHRCRLLCSHIRLDWSEVSTHRHKSLCRVFARLVYDHLLPGQAKEGCLAQAENEASFGLTRHGEERCYCGVLLVHFLACLDGKSVG